MAFAASVIVLCLLKLCVLHIYKGCFMLCRISSNHVQVAVLSIGRQSQCEVFLHLSASLQALAVDKQWFCPLCNCVVSLEELPH